MGDDDILHGALIGVEGARARLNTPVLVLDRDALMRNIAAMAAFARANKLALRPHAKTHKSADIARLQIEAGAVGVCCAKLGEAEALAEAAPDILITSPVVTAPAIARLIALQARMKALCVAVDHPENVRALAAAAAKERPLDVVIDVDPGIRRTGVSSPRDARALAALILGEPSLRLRGVQFYCGAHQHIADYAARAESLAERMAHLKTVIAAIEEAGARIALVTGGGTGTHEIDARIGVLTELQAGSYIFMDRQYRECDLAEGRAPFEPSLFVEASVISANAPGLVTLDCGFKALAADGGPPEVFAGAPAGAAFHFAGDEHGLLVIKGARLPLGARVTLVTPHCDPTVNLYDSYHVVRGETLEAIWPVSARGRAR